MMEREAIMAYASCEYLVLDDLGVGRLTEWFKKTLGYIIYERDNMFKPTLITSNLSLDELSIHFDPRISSRIAGMGLAVHVQGPGWRPKNAVCHQLDQLGISIPRFKISTYWE